MTQEAGRLLLRDAAVKPVVLARDKEHHGGKQSGKPVSVGNGCQESGRTLLRET